MQLILVKPISTSKQDGRMTFSNVHRNRYVSFTPIVLLRNVLQLNVYTGNSRRYNSG